MMPYSRIENQRPISNNVNRYTLVDWLFRLPFTEFPQYKLGLIDEEGNMKIPRSRMSPQQKQAYSIYDAAIINMKRLIKQLPDTQSKTWKYQFAQALLAFHKDMYESVDQKLKPFEQIMKEEAAACMASAPVNTTASTGVAQQAKENPPPLTPKKIIRRKQVI